jgi:hypothetical protein
MDAILGVGVPRHGGGGGWDLWLPAYMLLSLALLRVAGHLRLTAWTAAAAFAGGTLWAWAADAFGVVPAAGVAVLLAFAIGGTSRRLARPRADGR